MNSIPRNLEIAQIRDRLRFLEIAQRVIDLRQRVLAETTIPEPYRRRAPADAATRNARQALHQYPTP
jgi:hypothetical protein